MKDTAKRLIALLLVVAVMCTALIGCGGDSDVSDGSASVSDVSDVTSSTSDSDASTSTTSGDSSVEDASTTTSKSSASTTTTSTTTSTKPAKKTSLTLKQVMAKMPAKVKNSTIKFYAWEDVKQNPEWSVIEKFMKETGIKVEVEVGSYDNFKTLLATKIATDNSPDMVRLLNSSLARIKMLDPITVSGYDFNDTAWDEITMGDYTYNNKCYGMSLSNTPFLDTLVMLYDKEAFEEAGCEDPYSLWKKGKWTWSAFEKVAKQWIKQGSDYYGACRAPAMTFSLQKGVDMIKFDGKKFTNNLSNSAISDSLVRDIQYADQRYWGPKTWMMTEFVAGKVGFFFGSISCMRAGNTAFGKLSVREAVWAVPLPSEGSETPYQLLQENTAYGIPQGASNAAAVPYLLRYMLDYENYDADSFWTNNGSEVYDSVRSNKKRVDYRCSELITTDNGLSHYDIVNMIVSVVGSEHQVASGLQKYTGIVDDAVTKANQELAKLK